MYIYIYHIEKLRNVKLKRVNKKANTYLETTFGLKDTEESRTLNTVHVIIFYLSVL